jgi:DNA polymerase III subunit chi
MTAEALFYHLEHFPLDRVLPLLLEKTLDRGWKAVVQAGSVERVAALDTLLWTYRDDSFLPHGTAADGKPERQPVFLTDAEATPNAAEVRFLVDGAAPASFTAHQRFVFLFDGGDQDALAGARLQWKAAKAAGCTVTYWQQSADGRWEKKA